MDRETGTAFDFRLFKRVLAYTRPYRITFIGVSLAAILLSVFAVLSAIFLKNIVDEALLEKNAEKLIYYTIAMGIVLLGQVISQLLFNYYANWVGESVIKDIRMKLFRHMIGLRMKYYDTSSVGVLVTRAVADMQRIGEIFSQGFFVIVADLLHPRCGKRRPDQAVGSPLGEDEPEGAGQGPGIQPQFLCAGASHGYEDRTIVHPGRN